MTIRATVVVAALVATGLALPARASAAAIPRSRACYVVTDPPGDTRYFLLNMDAGGFDITSADIKVDNTYTTVVIRFDDFDAQDAWTPVWGKYVTFLWRPQGQKPGTDWYGFRARVPVDAALGAPIYNYGASTARTENVYTYGEAMGRVVDEGGTSEIHMWARNSALLGMAAQGVTVGSLKPGVRQGEFKITSQTLMGPAGGSNGTLLDDTDNDVTRGVYTSGQKSCIASAN